MKYLRLTMVMVLLLPLSVVAEKVHRGSNSSTTTLPITTVLTHTASITKQDLIWMFSQRKLYWDSGQRVKVVLLPWESRMHKKFVRNFLDVSPSRLRSAISQRIDRGQSRRFEQALSLEDAMNIVKHTPGSISYTTNYLITGDTDGKLKRINIIH